MAVRHPFVGPELTLRALPATARQMDFGAPDVGALVLIDGLDRPRRLDAGRVGSVLGLTPAESRVAVELAEGRTVPDIAVLAGRAESSIRTHPKRIHPSWESPAGRTWFAWCCRCSRHTEPRYRP